MLILHVTSSRFCLLIYLLNIHHFSDIFSYSHTEAHTHKHTCVLKTSWRRPEALVLDSWRATSVWCQGLGARARGRRVSFTTKSSSLWWLRSSVCILSSSTEGDAPSAEGAEVYEVKGQCCLLQQCHISFAHCSRHMLPPLAWGRGRPLAEGSELDKGWCWQLIALPSNRVLGQRKHVWCELVFWFFSQLPEDVGFSLFLFLIFYRCYHTWFFAFTSTLLSASLALCCLPDVGFRTFRVGWPSTPLLVTLATLRG